jgi:hypothetical protein
MNANELADYIETGGENIDRKELATMLRQQQAEIEALKVGKIRAYDNGFEDGRKPDTNPKSAKTLTDEEIEEVYRIVEQDFTLTESKKPDGGWRNFPVELARAILRKAQKK